VNTVTIAMSVFACAFGGAMVGIFLQRALPKSHLSNESKDVIKLGTGLVATMAALVLGLLVGTAKSSFDSQKSGFQQLATNFILLDRTLAHYGPDAKPAREQLRTTVSSLIERLWPTSGPRSSGLDDVAITADASEIYDLIRKLSPQDDLQRSVQSQALQIGNDLARNRWQLSQPDDGSLPIPFLAVLAFWLFVLFSSFGLFSPANATVIAVLLVCALSVAGAVFLIVDLDQPFEGLLQVSSAPLRAALSQLGK
jgi:Protein of unknown function (DUF4239)